MEFWYVKLFAERKCECRHMDIDVGGNCCKHLPEHKYAEAVLWNNFQEEFRKTNSFSHFKSPVAHLKGRGGGCKCTFYR